MEFWKLCINFNMYSLQCTEGVFLTVYERSIHFRIWSQILKFPAKLIKVILNSFFVKLSGLNTYDYLYTFSIRKTIAMLKQFCNRLVKPVPLLLNWLQRRQVLRYKIKQLLITHATKIPSCLLYVLSVHSIDIEI